VFLLLKGLPVVADPTPEQVRIYRSMSPAKKLELINRLNQTARRLKAAGLRMQHPEWTEEQVSQRVKEVFLYAGDR
jgi:hypothetical protein